MLSSFLSPCTGWGLAQQHSPECSLNNHCSGPLGVEVGEGRNVLIVVRNSLKRRAGCSIYIYPASEWTAASLGLEAMEMKPTLHRTSERTCRNTARGLDEGLKETTPLESYQVRKTI